MTPGGVRRQRVILVSGMDRALHQRCQGLYQGGPSDLRQAMGQLSTGFIHRDRSTDPMIHRTAVESCFHLHHADTGLGFAVQDRPGNGGGAPQLRKQRSVEVDHPHSRRVQDIGAENVPIGDHDTQIGIEPAQGFGEDVTDRFDRLEDRDVEVVRDQLDGGRDQPGAGTSPGFVRLGHYGHHVESRRQQRLERRHREARRSEEHDTHQADPAVVEPTSLMNPSSRCSFL